MGAIRVIVILFCLLFYIPSWAANLCVSPSGAGAKTGADWDNAIDWSTKTLVRGDTYYLADGSYAAKTISVAVSGTDLITVKKAVVASHVTATGWADSMGDGQADFAQPISIQTSYIVWDGVVGSGSNPTTYGFKINAPLTAVCEAVGGGGRYQTMMLGTNGTSYSTITVSRTAFSGCGSLVQTDQARLISSNPTALDTVTITYNYFTDAVNNILLRNWTTGEIAYNYFNNNYSGVGSYEHGQQISAGTSSGIKLHDNVFKDTTIQVIGYHRGVGAGVWQVYNNIVTGSLGDYLNGVWVNADPGVDADRNDLLVGWVVFNNTYANLVISSGYGLFYDQVSDPETKIRYLHNNLFYNITGIRGTYLPADGSVVHTYNGYYGTIVNEPAEATKQVSASSPFVGAADFNLTIGTTPIDNGCSTACAGGDLTAITTVDYDVITRPRGAAWDIGAYEYGGIIGNQSFGSTTASGSGRKMGSTTASGSGVTIQ